MKPTVMIRSSALDASPGKIGLILGSTRPGGNGRTVADWVQQLIRNEEHLYCEYHFVDLAAWNLPLFDEPVVPAKSPPVHEHTKAWQQQVAALDGFLFVTPQYNWGYPAALKNALDYLYREWNNKPAAIVSYGGRGGGKAAAQLREVLQGLRMRVVEASAGIKLKEEHVLHGADPATVDVDFAEYAADVVKTVTELDELVAGVQASS